MSVVPFSLTIEPLKKLLVINVLGDLEVEMIEPQIYSDPVHGDLLRVLLYRKDKMVDVYYQKGLPFNPNKFSIGEGLGYYGETNFVHKHFEIDDCGVDLNLSFLDKNRRVVEVIIKETIKSKARFPFLAPVGKDIKDPDRFFLVDMMDFGFVKREGTLVRVVIDGKSLKLENFPIPFGGKKVYFARYSSKLLIGELNSSLTSLKDAKLSANVDGMVAEIRFPEDAKSNIWEYYSDDKKITGGSYNCKRVGDKVEVVINVEEKWRPSKLPFAFSLFTFVVSSFRTWPTLYTWKGSIDLNDLSVKGHWIKRK